MSEFETGYDEYRAGLSGKPKEFVEQFNDIAAPLTRAWTEPVIERLEIGQGGVQENEITATVVVKLKRRTEALG